MIEDKMLIKLPTRKDFDKFAKIVEEYAKEFGLKDWDIYVRFDKNDEDNEPLGDEMLAQTSTCTHSRVATITLNSKCKQLDLRNTARHEVMHVVVSELGNIARDRYVQNSEITDAIERITVLMCNIIGCYEEKCRRRGRKDDSQHES